MKPLRLLRTARATRRALAGSPVPPAWTADAAKTQVRLASGRVDAENGLVRVGVGAFDVAGFSRDSLAYLHREIFVELQYYFDAGRRDPFIVDGGSNIGMSVLFFKALYADARIVAFEPARPAYDVLVRNVEANDLRDVDAHQVALGREEGEIPFYEDPGDPSTFRMSVRPERLCGTATNVPQRRLSTFLPDRVDLLKLDVEGAEDDVLAELAESGALSRVEQLVVEYHHQLAPERDFLDSFLAHVREAGFRYEVRAAPRIKTRLSGPPGFQDVLVYARRA